MQNTNNFCEMKYMIVASGAFSSFYYLVEIAVYITAPFFLTVDRGRYEGSCWRFIC